jgi:hypothetical protein
MKTVYFDRNVFADICDRRNGITTEDINLIKKAVEKRLISIPTSLAILGETAVIAARSVELFLKHLRTIEELVDKNYIVKDAQDILLEDCLSYASRMPTRSILPVSFSFEKAFQNPTYFPEFAKNYKDTMKVVAQSITESLLALRESTDMSNPAKDFEEAWKTQAIKSVHMLLRQLSEKNKRKCVKRGMVNMLLIPSVLIRSIYISWFFYAGGFGIEGTPRKVRSNDVVDMVHSIQASATDIFVTQENPAKSGTIPFLLNHVQIPGFRLMDLEGFITFLKE